MLKLPKGITLIELLVAIAVISILAVVAIPTIRSTVQNYRATAAAEELYSALQLARSEAVKRNTSVYVSFVSGSNWCYGINPGSACSCNTAGSCTLGAFSPPQSGQTSLSTTYGGNVFFEGNHAAANASGSVTFTVDGTSRAMTVNIGRLGSVRICSTDISGYSAC